MALYIYNGSVSRKAQYTATVLTNFDGYCSVLAVSHIRQGLRKVAVVTSVILTLSLPKGKNPILSTETLRFAQDYKKDLIKGPGCKLKNY